MIPTTLLRYLEEASDNMWRTMKNTVMRIFATTPRQQAAEQLEEIRRSHDEITRELVNVIDLGNPPPDWQPPQHLIRHPRDLL